MGKGKKAAIAFIESIPDAKLEGLPTSGGTIFKDTNFRLDMQGVCTPLSSMRQNMLKLVTLTADDYRRSPESQPPSSDQ